MPRTPSRFTQSDLARAARVAVALPLTLHAVRPAPGNAVAKA